MQKLSHQLMFKLIGGIVSSGTERVHMRTRSERSLSAELSRYASSVTGTG